MSRAVFAWVDCAQPGCGQGTTTDARNLTSLAASGGWYCPHHEDDGPTPDHVTLTCAQPNCAAAIVPDHRHVENLTAAAPWCCPRHQLARKRSDR